MMNTLLEFLRTCWPALLATALAAYLLGSVNCAIIVTRLLDKTDIREHGSGNAGATNVLLLTGKAARAVDNYRGFGQKHHFRPSGRLFHEGPIPPECLQQ